jgi:hypothetical protein
MMNKLHRVLSYINGFTEGMLTRMTIDNIILLTARSILKFHTRLFNVIGNQDILCRWLNNNSSGVQK